MVTDFLSLYLQGMCCGAREIGGARYRSARAIPVWHSCYSPSRCAVLGMLGAELFMARLSLVVLIAGMILFLAGRQTLWSIAFPIGYLLFMIPLPAIVYYQLTLPLQLWASRLGATGLVALGIHTVREGNLLFLPNCTLNVVEACSGIRSLLSLLAAVVAYGYFAESSTWKRTVLAVTSIPIAIATNGLRLVATGVLSYYYGPAWIQVLSIWRLVWVSSRWLFFRSCSFTSFSASLHDTQSLTGLIMMSLRAFIAATVLVGGIYRDS